MKKTWIIPVALLATVGTGYALWKIKGDRWMRQRMEKLPGNGAQYDPKKLKPVLDSPLKGKRILFLGSSITEGYGGCGVSFADYLEMKHGIIAGKEAVCGTTLVDIGKDSYVQRLRNVDATQPWDLLVCQLSTNDASRQLPLGEISEDGIYHANTVAGAIETILAFARDTLRCPVVFYTNPRYASKAYGQMVQRLYRLQERWGFTIIDLWNDVPFNNITQDQRRLYMADRIHPTRAGYLSWWLPKFEAHLTQNINYGNAEDGCQ